MKLLDMKNPSDASLRSGHLLGVCLKRRLLPKLGSGKEVGSSFFFLMEYSFTGVFMQRASSWVWYRELSHFPNRLQLLKCDFVEGVGVSS